MVGKETCYRHGFITKSRAPKLDQSVYYAVMYENQPARTGQFHCWEAFSDPEHQNDFVKESPGGYADKNRQRSTYDIQTVDLPDTNRNSELMSTIKL